MALKVGGIVVGLALLLALLGPFVAPYDPSDQALARRLEGPSRAHVLGLDELGRDVGARILHGARISLAVGVSVVAVSSTLGLLLGMLAGYLGGRV
ncbi:MAG: ABC transporter permease, partial [Vicinamibacteraceae bacterium]